MGALWTFLTLQQIWQIYPKYWTCRCPNHWNGQSANGVHMWAQTAPTMEYQHTSQDNKPVHFKSTIQATSRQQIFSAVLTNKRPKQCTFRPPALQYDSQWFGTNILSTYTKACHQPHKGYHWSSRTQSELHTPRPCLRSHKTRTTISVASNQVKKRVTKRTIKCSVTRPALRHNW